MLRRPRVELNVGLHAPPQAAVAQVVYSVARLRESSVIRVLPVALAVAATLCWILLLCYVAEL